MNRHELLAKLLEDNGSTRIIGFSSNLDAKKAYNSAKELEVENKIEIKDILIKENTLSITAGSFLRHL